VSGEAIKREGFHGKTGGSKGTSAGAYYGAGTYFHTDKAHADEYLKGVQAYERADAHQITAHADVKNPFKLTIKPNDQGPGEAMHRALRESGVIKPGEKLKPDEITRRLQAKGHDAVEIHQPGKLDPHFAGSQLVVFNPKQAKYGEGRSKPRNLGDLSKHKDEDLHRMYRETNSRNERSQINAELDQRKQSRTEAMHARGPSVDKINKAMDRREAGRGPVIPDKPNLPRERTSAVKSGMTPNQADTNKLEIEKRALEHAATRRKMTKREQARYAQIKRELANHPEAQAHAPEPKLTRSDHAARNYVATHGVDKAKQRVAELQASGHTDQITTDMIAALKRAIANPTTAKGHPSRTIGK
jgi:hypothetical protein